jgi:Ca2+-binding RTX toxin-like protein
MAFSRIFSSSQILVFIDATVDDYQQLANSVIPDAEAIVLDPAQDGITQITTILAQHYNVRQIHIVSHGSPGCLHLGNTQLSLSTIDHYTPDLQRWQQATDLSSTLQPALSTSFSLFLYGCNVAAGDAGAEFVEHLHRLTGATIAASSTRTGSTAFGGNWQLDVRVGQIEGVIAFQPDVIEQYNAVLNIAVQPGGLVDPDQEIEIVGGDDGDPSLNLHSAWFFHNDLGTTGGPTGASDGSPGFGLYGAGAHSGPPQFNGGAFVLYVNGQNFAIANNDYASWTGVIGPGGYAYYPPNTPTDYYTLTGKNQLAGLNVTDQFYIDRHQDLVRDFITFQNPTNADITVPISIATNLTTGNSTKIEATSSGDTTFTKDDRWIITDKNGDQPTNTQVLFGPGTPVVTPDSVAQKVFSRNGTNNGILANYTITIPKNSERSLLFFDGIYTYYDAGPDSGKGYVGTFDDINKLKNPTDKLLLGLSDEQLAKTLNWDFGYGITVSSAKGTTTEAGGTATFNVALKSKPNANVTLNLKSSDTTEGTVLAPSLTFTPDNWNTPQQVIVKGVADGIKDGDIAYKVLTSFTTTDSRYAINTPISFSLTNKDDGSTGGIPGGGTPGGGTPGGETPGGETSGGSTPNSPNTPTPPSSTELPNSVHYILGTSGKNTLVGSPEADVILGFGKNDKLIGGDGNDTLNGGNGNDKIKGGNGQDILIGGRGRNILIGGHDRDLFDLEKHGVDIIRDFKDHQDHLGLSQGLKVKQLGVFQDGGKTLITFKHHTLAILNGVKANHISAADFTRVVI